MASIRNNKSTMHDKAFLLGIIGFFAVAFIFGISITYAYYHSTEPFSILASLVADFDNLEADINIVVYKENTPGVYVKTYYVPQAGYVFDDTLTSCTVSSCVKDDTTSACYYTYNAETYEFSLTSNERVTCKYYFNKITSSDINVYVLKENENGTDYTYNNKKYVLADSIPAYNYEYTNHYTCTNGATMTYDANTRKFNVSTGAKTDCYVYFDAVGAADIIANIYVQSSAGGSTYEQVNSIPTNNTYILSTGRTSYCYDENENNTNVTITYQDGYIYIPANGKQTCDVYLDLVS